MPPPFPSPANWGAPASPVPAAPAPAPAPAAAAPAAPAAPAAGNANPFGTKSLEYTGGDDPNNKNYKKLSEALNEADTERRKEKEAADLRERAAEIRREERMRKIAYMEDMPDSTPAGTGKFNCFFSLYRVFWSSCLLFQMR